MRNCAGGPMPPEEDGLHGYADDGLAGYDAGVIDADIYEAYSSACIFDGRYWIRSSNHAVLADALD